MFKDLIKVGKHSAIYGLGKILQRLIGFLLIPIYTRYLTPTDYGVVAVLLLTMIVVESIWTDAVNNVMSRFYFNYKSQKDRNEVVSTNQVMQIVFILTISTLGFWFSRDICLLLFGTAKYVLLLRLMVGTFFFSSVTAIPMTLLRLKERSLHSSIVNLAKLLLAVFLNILFIVILDMGLFGLFLSGTINAFIFFLILTPKMIFETGLRFSLEKTKPMVKYMLPLIPAGGLSLLLLKSDIFLLQKLSTTANAGLYNLAEMFGQATHVLILAPFGFIWFPFVFSNFKRPKIRETLSRIQTYVLFLLILAGLAVSMLIRPVLAVMVGPGFFELYKAVPVIILAFFFFGLYQAFFNIGFLIRKKTKYQLLVQGISAIIIIALNLLLIPTFGFMGAAISKLIAFSLLALIAYAISFKLYNIPIEKRVVGMFFLAILFYFISKAIPIKSAITHLLLDAILLILFIITLYLFKFFRDDELNKIKQILYKFKKVGTKNIIRTYFMNPPPTS